MPALPTDPALPRLEAALDRDRAEAVLRAAHPGLASARLMSAHLLRHKPGKRCLIEYRFAGPSAASFRLFGKMQAKGVDRKSLDLQRQLHAGSFGPAATDRIRVPEPLGGVPELHLWLQRWVPGISLGDLLATSRAAELATRAADALVKLQIMGPAPLRVWSLADELRVLRERHAVGAALLPAFEGPFTELLLGSERLAARLPPSLPTPAHRDFYPDQLMLRGEDLYLVDLDVYALADPALDAGNFEAHLLELKVRGRGDPASLERAAHAFRDRFMDRRPTVPPLAIEHYLTLSLVRLAFLAPLFPDRHRALSTLIDVARARLLRGRFFETSDRRPLELVRG